MRYVIGIDLGTTNCSLAFADMDRPPYAIGLFSVPQLSDRGEVEALPTLPSFCYSIASEEWPEGSLRLPWKEETASFVGQFAKIRGARVPTRLVHSAKSWLSNGMTNGRDKILPVEAASGSIRLSPVEASSKYLIHLRDAWNDTMAKGDPLSVLEEQEIIVTVPASFDEPARTLTVEAARRAGFLHLTLIEEPQAAFYSWIAGHEKEWQTYFKEGDRVLVCDVGGGTTDFSLIEIRSKEGKLFFQRTAVGDHLLLGGDNIDAAVARYLEQKIEKEHSIRLNSLQFHRLQSEARSAKEVLLRPEASEEEIRSVVIPGTGSSVIKGSLSATLSREEVEKLLSEGFFGLYPFSEALHLRRSRGIRTMGLPYEDEPSITKHLARFLDRALGSELKKGIDFILFNGGTFKPESFRSAVEESLHLWFPGHPVHRLPTVSLDLAVGRGAAYYGKMRRGFGVAVEGGLPRTYYLKIECLDSTGRPTEKALTLVPRGASDGYLFRPDRLFSVRANIPVAFRLLASNVRIDDKEGEIVEIDPSEMQELPSLQTILRFGKKAGPEATSFVPVTVGVRLSEIGTLELWLESRDTDHRWNLEFQLRSATGQESPVTEGISERTDEVFEKGYSDESKRLIERLFSPDATMKPSAIMEKLEVELNLPRGDWGPSLLRQLWESLLKSSTGRKQSPELEARWWNMAGFFLRPGYGFPLDDFRIKELWKIILNDLKETKSPEAMIQMCICFRRIAGGLNKGQQTQIGAVLLPGTVDKIAGKNESRSKGNVYFYSEKIRALAAMERIDTQVKIKFGAKLIEEIIRRNYTKEIVWSLGRVGARHLLYGSAGHVVPQAICSGWIERLLTLEVPEKNRRSMLLLFEQLARKTDHRELNIEDVLIKKILNRYPDEHLEKALTELHSLTENEREKAFGERLPVGLVLA